LGDLNAKIGKEKAYENVTGKHTLHDISNQNGEMICNFAIENNMTVISTHFQHNLALTRINYSKSNWSHTYKHK